MNKFGNILFSFKTNRSKENISVNEQEGSNLEQIYDLNDCVDHEL